MMTRRYERHIDWCIRLVPGEPADVVPGTAALFLRGQEAWLVRGLEQADDLVEVAIVLTATTAAHESWLALIAAVDRWHGPAAAERVAALYAFHGRVAGSLERSLRLRLDTDSALAVRALLADRLAELTDAAVDACCG